MKSYRLLLIITIFLSLFVYLYKLEVLPYTFHTDEGETALQVRKILRKEEGLVGVGWGTLPLLSFVPQVLTVAVFGENIIGSRIASVIFGLSTLVFFYYLVRLLLGNRVALMAVIFLAFSHIWIAFARLGIANIQAVFLLVATIFLTVRGFQKDRLRDFLLGGLFLALCFYSYSGARMAALLILVYFFLILLKGEAIKRRFLQLLMLIISALIIFFPQAGFYFTHQEAFFSRFQYVYFLSEAGRSWTAPEYADKSPARILLSQFEKSINIFAGDRGTQYGYDGQLLDYPTLVLIILGAFSLIKFSPRIFVFLFIWILLSLIVGQVLTTIPSPIFLPRLLVSLPAVFILAGFGLESIYRKLGQRRIISKLLILSIIFVIIIGNLNIYFFEYPKKLSRDNGARMATDLARYVNSLGSQYQVVYLTQPYFDGDFSSLRFLTSDKGLNIGNPELYQVFKDKGDEEKPRVYIIHRNYWWKLPELMAVYPYGKLEELESSDGQREFLSLKIGR